MGTVHPHAARHLSQAALLVVPLALAACTASPSGQAPDLSVAQEEVRAASESLINAESGKDMDAAMAFYADNAIVQPPDAPQVEGAEAIRGVYDQIFNEMPISELGSTSTAIHVSADGTLAWEYGVNRVVLDTPEGPNTDMGKYLAVWAKQDGSWKVVALAFSSDAPPPPSTESN
ncbi:MAG: DUF4440 domain-containing protein [Gemmatimonadota bacterium]|jgi:ketosteroid isomerase-like protein